MRRASLQSRGLARGWFVSETQNVPVWIRWWRQVSVRRRALLLALWAGIATVLLAFWGILLPFVGALLLAYVIEPIVQLGTRIEMGTFRVPRWLSVVVIYVMFFGVLSVGVGAVFPRMAGEVQRISESVHGLLSRFDEQAIERQINAVETWMWGGVDTGGGDALSERAPVESSRGAEQAEVGDRADRQASVPPSDTAPGAAAADTGSGQVIDLDSILRDGVQRAKEGIREGVGQLVGLMRKLALAVADALFTFMLLLMLTAFISIDAARIKRFFMSLVPVGYEGGTETLLSRIDAGLSGVVRGQLTIMVVNGALTFVGLWLFGVKYALFLAFVATIFYVVPIFGTIISSVPIVLVALGDSFSKALAILAWIIGIHALEAYYLNPKILGDAAKIHPVLIVFALLAGEHVGGAVGVLLAVPAMSVAVVIFRFAYRRVEQLGEQEAALAQNSNSSARESQSEAAVEGAQPENA